MTTFTLTKHLTNWKGLFQNVVRTFLINNFWTRSLVPQTLYAREKNFVGRSLREKCPYSEFFWSVVSRIRTKYSVRMPKNTDQNNF